MDNLHRIGGRVPYRCRKCRHRFFSSEVLMQSDAEVAQSANAGQPRHAHRKTRQKSPRSRKRLVRGLIAFVIFAVMFLIFWVFLRYLTTERAPAQNSSALRFLSTTPPDTDINIHFVSAT